MNWDGDLDLTAVHKSIAKQGRRAGKSLLNTPETSSNIGEDNPPEVRGGWAEDAKRSSRNRGSAGTLESEQIEEPSRLESGDDIPIIPDIDDIQDDLLTLQEIKAPNLSVNNATYKELESELSDKKVFSQTSTDDCDIDFTFMEREVFKNYKNSDVVDDEVWTMESLHNEIIKSQ